MLVSTEHLNYLQRIGLNDDESQLVNVANTSGEMDRTLLKITGYGQFRKGLAGPQADLPSKDILAGLYGNKIPVAFYISGSPASVNFYIGTWKSNNADTNVSNGDAELEQRIGVIKTSLESGYAALSIEDLTHDDINLDKFSLAGLVMGVPTVKTSETVDITLPIERLVRTMHGLNWGCLILAQPVSQSKTNELRLTAIDEMKRASGASDQGQNPLANYYIDALQQTVLGLTFGLMSGIWRTGVYLLGDKNSYSRLSTAWIGIFSGDQSYPDSISLLSTAKIIELVRDWKLPDVPEIMGPGKYRHPLKYQTLLNSSQLSAYIHLPQQETNGFSINILPNFDAIPPKTHSDKTIKIGEIVHRSRPTNNSYMIDLDKLNGHVFVSGITGCGKTNTLFQLLTQAYAFKMPFLVIEPAKNEYRALIKNSQLKDNLLVFTPGNEMISPFRLNPFEVVCWPKIRISKHIDYLRSVFTASFGMWEPLPQILESCLFAIYKDKGWDITTNENCRLENESDSQNAFPTMSDLADKVNVVIQNSGYEDKIKDDMRSALLTRINSLRIGGKGRMLDVQFSLPMDLLLKNPTVLELDGMGDDDDKAFIMGLLFIRLVEYRISQGEQPDLQHLLVIEEAHRLLLNVNAHGPADEANPRGKAVEEFSNLISEVRAYGQGLIVVDQVPVKLASDVIKNTNIKIVHQCVSVEDRMILAGATAMTDIQRDSITSFVTGQAAVFSGGDDAPILVKVDRAPEHEKAPADHIIKQMMDDSKQLVEYHPRLDPIYGIIGDNTDTKLIELSRELGRSSSFQQKIARMILSIVEQENSFTNLFNNLLVYIREVCKEGMVLLKLQKAVLFFAAKCYAGGRGDENNWTYAKTNEFEIALRNLLFSKLLNDGVERSLSVFRDGMYKQYKRSFEPFAGCDKICVQERPACLYRQAVAGFIKNSPNPLKDDFYTAFVNDRKADDKALEKTLSECDKAVYTILNQNIPDSIPAKRIALCYAQQNIKDFSLEVHDIILNELVKLIN